MQTNGLKAAWIFGLLNFFKHMTYNFQNHGAAAGGNPQFELHIKKDI